MSSSRNPHSAKKMFQSCFSPSAAIRWYLVDADKKMRADKEVASWAKHFMNVSRSAVGPEQMLPNFLGVDEIEGFPHQRRLTNVVVRIINVAEGRDTEALPTCAAYFQGAHLTIGQPGRASRLRDASRRATTVRHARQENASRFCMSPAECSEHGFGRWGKSHPKLFDWLEAQFRGPFSNYHGSVPEHSCLSRGT
jgi:hypothetical protein